MKVKSTEIHIEWFQSPGRGRSANPGKRRSSPSSPAALRTTVAAEPAPPSGMVYAMTNDAERNEVIAYIRADDGTLVRQAGYPTGGAGTGEREISPATPQDGVDPLASQGSLSLSLDARLLFAVNAGSGTLSSFRVMDDGSLVLVEVVSSGGLQPNSLGVHENLLYVSNVGDEGNGFTSNVTGFHIGRDGSLTEIPGSTRSLSTRNAQPARVLFSPEGGLLAVSELTTNRITVFRVRADRTLSDPTVNASNGAGPFGSVFLSTGRLLVSEAGASALSSYAVTLDGALIVVSGSIPTMQQASCWVVTTPNERYAYTSNTDSGTISSYAVGPDGSLNLIDATAAGLQGPSPRPIDSGISPDGRYFYVLDGGQGAVAAFRIEADGTLRGIQTLTDAGLPRLGAQGLAVR